MSATTSLVPQARENRRPAAQCAVLCGALVCSTAGLLVASAGSQHPDVGHLAESQANPQGAVAWELTKYARPGEALGIWGWMNRFYVEARLRQATRDAHSQAEIVTSPHRSYFRQRYLADLQASAPPVFVDAVGAGNFIFQSREQTPDVTFPELAAYLRAHYTLVGAAGGSRIYVRNDRLMAVHP